MDLFLASVNLQLFGEGGAAAAGSGAPAGAGSAEASGPASPEGKEHNHLAEALGMTAEAQAEEAQPAQEQNQRTEAEEWAEAKKGRYKQFYDADVQEAVQRRFKNQQDLQQKLDAMQPIIDALYQQRGIEAGDLEALRNSVIDDEDFLEQEAMRHEMSIDAYKAFRELQQEHDQRQAQEQANVEQRMIDQHLQSLAQQGEELKALYPDFDLRTELQNPEFFRLTSPGVKVSVRRAYEVLHPEITSELMAASAQQAQRKLANAIQANGMRPSEAGLSNQTAASVTIDPRKLTDQQYSRIVEQIRKGNYISFD